MAKTNEELLQEIADAQGITLKEAKEAVAEAKASKQAITDLTTTVEKLNTEFKAKDATIKDLQDEVKEVKAKAGRTVLTPTEKRKIWLGDAIAQTIGRHEKEFKAGYDGANIGRLEVKADGELEQKTVGNIASANLTGTGNNYISYLDWQPGMEPLGQDHFRSIFRTINSETDFVRFPRANTPIGEGSFARVNEAATKPQVDRDYTMIDLTLKPMAGYAIVSRQSLRNIVFLQSWLPTSMMEQLMDAEDVDFANALVAAATGSTSTTGITNAASKSIGPIVAYMTRLRAAKYRTDFLATDPIVWANTILNTETNAGFNLPNIVTVDANGNVRILGVPIIPVNWLTGGRILTGDSRRAAIVQSEGLVLRQTDSHASTFITNELTFLLERTEGLAIFRPDAFQTAVLPLP